MNIAKYRKGAGITQEQLAEQLSVSISAVSQWETGKTLPDISAIPILCHVLNISSDALLDIDHAKDEVRIKEVIAEAWKLMDRGQLTKAENLIIGTLKQFPNRYDLMEVLMNTYFMHFQKSDLFDASAEEKEKGKQYLKKCIVYAEKISNECTDENKRIVAKRILCMSYDALGEIAKTYDVAKTMPSMQYSMERMCATIGKGQVKFANRQAYLFGLLVEVCQQLTDLNMEVENGKKAYTQDEEIALSKKTIELVDLLFEDQDFGFFHEPMMRSYLKIAGILAGEKTDSDSESHIEKVMEYLKKAADHAEGFLSNKADKKHTSLIFRGSEYGNFGSVTDDNSTAQLLNEMNKPCFDSIRKVPEFKELIKRLKKTAAKWN